MVTLLPSTATKTITITPADVATSLNISAPSSAKKGASFRVYGQLTRNDTGVAVPGAGINLSYNGQSIGTPTTDMQGVYDISMSIPNEGTFTLKANFAGGSGYAASEAQSRISVSVPTSLTAIVSIVLPIAVGLGVATLWRK